MSINFKRPAYRSLFMPGANPNDPPHPSRLSIGPSHYPVWLDAERAKGRQFELVRVFIQTEHVCTLDGAPVIFRGDLTYDVPKEIAEILAAPRPGALPIAVVINEQPETGPSDPSKKSKEEEKE